MITLKELVYEQRYQDISDMEIIKLFLTQNDLEDEALEMITELSALKVRRLMRQIGISCERMLIELKIYEMSEGKCPKYKRTRMSFQKTID